ncbi:hypothetical protein QN239_31915 [Mycolicibacterium sp. Y3]
MPLLLLDLDNTLVDCAAAFLRWARRFTAMHGGDVEWFVAADADGYEPRDRLADRIRAEYSLDDAVFASVRADLNLGMADDLVLDANVPLALARARTAGWVPVVVTNGPVSQPPMSGLSATRWTSALSSLHCWQVYFGNN